MATCWWRWLPAARTLTATLVRKIIEVSGVDPQTTDLNGKPLADHLLAPTRIYVKSVLDLIANVDCTPSPT